MRRIVFGAVFLLVGCRNLLVPSHDFDESAVPTPPDYAKPAAWAALPDRTDDADVVPEGEADRQATAAVDVFFVHPTTYYKKDGWNQPLDDQDPNEFTDEKVLRNQASAFNEAGRIYAPRYRQATLGVFFAEDKSNSVKALDLAYGDVLAAFDYFLEHYNDGRPFILASHSQGSYHSMRLLADRIAGTPLGDRLVAAYIIGFPIPTDHFERTIAPVPPCREEQDTGCLVTWLAWKDDTRPDVGRADELTIPYGGELESNAGKSLHCTNPLTWTTTSMPAGKEHHLGAVKFEDDDVSPKPEPNYVEQAYCDENVLFVRRPDNRYSGFMENLHIVDYTLFYMDIRKNAVARATAFLDRANGEAEN